MIMGMKVGMEVGMEVEMEVGMEVEVEMGMKVGKEVGMKVGKEVGMEVGIEVGRQEVKEKKIEGEKKYYFDNLVFTLSSLPKNLGFPGLKKINKNVKNYLCVDYVFV
jgi:histidinol phosphatase-like enzyme